jgi:hypothetical protein
MMKKKLTLLIFILPVLVMAQTDYKNGTLTIDFGKKKPKQEDTVQQQPQTVYPSDEEDQPKPEKKKKQSASKDKNEIPDEWRQNGLFKALFHAGVIGAQIDGDGYAGYNKIGLDAGVGALVRFHKYLSASLELNYAMEGARQRITPNPQSTQLYQVQWDYLQVPISLNIHDKKLIMFSLGIQPGVMIRYKERNENGDDDTNNPPNGQPKRFDLSAFGMLNFVIKNNYCLGVKFSYSVISIRGPQYPGLTRLLGEYNNVLAFRFTYIMDTVKKKK